MKKIISLLIISLVVSCLQAQSTTEPIQILYESWTHPDKTFFKRSTVMPKMDQLLYGVAYYDEYMPVERLDKDVQMMKDAGINVVRIAESTWGTMETAEGVYDFSHIDRVLKAMCDAGIKVIVGTPTYAVPAWMVKKYPDILAVTPNGQNQYGARQNMDITNIHYITYAQEAIEKLIEHVAQNPAVIGYQVDNETKSYGTCGPNVQKLFVEYMKNKFVSLDTINDKFGLNYWSNRINSWDEFPSMVGTINGSLKSEFSKFQRNLVTNFLAWQCSLVDKYKRDDQFITQNLDFDWRGYSYGIQPEVDHTAVANYLDIAGVDIYHPTQDYLTGEEISFGGDWIYSLKHQNYFVIETEAQGFAEWTPYPGQLRLQAFSHIASGANMVAYWPWHSIHNSAETYWKGLLSHDFQPNPTYNEAKTIGADFKKLSDKIMDLKRTNNVAIYVSNEALTAFNQFKFGWYSSVTYNDILRPFYNSLYKMNVGVDFITPDKIDKLSDYKLVIVPVLYASSDAILNKFNTYVKNGGNVVYTFKSGFCDQNVKVRTSAQPGIINQSLGIYYSQFTKPVNVGIRGKELNASADQGQVKYWMDLVTSKGADVWATYNHPVWGKYAAVTNNHYGKGNATYIGFMPGDDLLNTIMQKILRNTGLWGIDQDLQFPVITKEGINSNGKNIRYFFNYSSTPQTVKYEYSNGKSLLDDSKVKKDSEIKLVPWGVKIIEY